jgi:hypothetical protein
LCDVTLFIVSSEISAAAMEVADHGSPIQISCPKCGSSDVRRSQSEGALAAFFRIFGRWPFRCRSCRARFFRVAAPENF